MPLTHFTQIRNEILASLGFLLVSIGNVRAGFRAATSSNAGNHHLLFVAPSSTSVLPTRILILTRNYAVCRCRHIRGGLTSVLVLVDPSVVQISDCSYLRGRECSCYLQVSVHRCDCYLLVANDAYLSVLLNAFYSLRKERNKKNVEKKKASTQSVLRAKL